MDLQPTLTADRLIVRPLTPQDWDALYAAAKDPLIWAQHPNHDRWKADVFRGFFDGALASRGGFAIIERATGQVVGSSRYNGYDADKREVEIGWTFLARRLWGGSYNRELKALMIEHALKFVDRVLFLVDSENARSRKAMEKIGGELIRSFPRDGRTVVVYAVTRPLRS